MSFSIRSARALLDSFFGKTSTFGALASAPTIYVGLSTTTPAEDGSNITEPSGGSYARVATTGATWNSATNADPAITTNAAAITFPTASANWSSGSNMTHFVLMDAASSGNMLAAGALTTAKPVLNGDAAVFDIGTLSVSLD